MNARQIIDRLLEDDGANRRELAALVERWVANQVKSKEILAKLSALGVITAEEETDQDTYVEPGSKEHVLIHIFLPSGQILTVEEDGNTFRDKS